MTVLLKNPKHRMGMYPYSKYRVYKPIVKDGRASVCLVHSVSGKRTTISYAKYIYCVLNERKVPKGYEVDHKDGDKSYDVISNLQVLAAHDNKTKGSSNKVLKNKRLDWRFVTKNPKVRKQNCCKQCGKLTYSDVYCSVSCFNKQQAWNIPKRNELLKLYKEVQQRKRTWESLGVMYGVSSNSVRKWMRKYEIM